MTVIRNYAQADAYLGRKAERPLPGRATRIRRVNDSTIAIRYHDTDVVTYQADGSALLNTGGWRTLTTKDRMNTYGPKSVAIWQERGVWRVTVRGENGAPRYTTLFRDGLIVTPTGDLATSINAPHGPVISRKAVGKFASKMVKAWLDGTLEAPNTGDCWFCYLRDQSGTPMGDATGQHDHLAEHIRDGYLVPSLLKNAVIAHGKEKFSEFDRDLIARWWAGEARPDDNFTAGIIRYTGQRIRAAIIAYFSHRFEFVD
jgi:hypothetical protein